MADLAVGISKTAVEVLVNKVKSAVEEEVDLWQIVQRDLVFIKDEFEMMESFLNTADGQRIRNNVMKTWVRQIGDLSYHLEDCAELVDHLDTKRAWWGFWLRLLPTCCKSGAAQPLDEAVAEIKLLKARVEEVSQRNIRYNLVDNSGSKSVVQTQQMTTANTRSFNILDATNSHSGFLGLTKLITSEDSNLRVISVCGAGGELGTVSMIREAYNDSRIKKNFKCRAWVKLMHPFNPQDLIRDMVAQFYTYSSQQEQDGGVHFLSRTEAFDPVSEFVHQVDTHRYLIVIEDIFSLAQWDVIRAYLPDRKKGSRLIVSTHQLEIASLCTGKPYRVLELSQFSADHSAWVFFKEECPKHPKYLRPAESRYWTRPSFGREVASDCMNNCFLVGRDREVDKLHAMISSAFSSRESNVVSVFGISGVGKSALVKTVFNRYVAEKEYGMFNMCGWVNVSHPFNLIDFSQRLLLDMCSDYAERISLDALQDDDVIQECRDILHQCPCLVVIDGLQSEKQWDQIKAKMLHGNYRSCTIVITTEVTVARYCVMSSDHALCEVKSLEEDATLDLFRKVFPFGSSLNEDMIDEVKLLISKCDGLPKQIVALAGYLGPLANRPRDIQERERKRLNANFMQELALAKGDSFQSIFAWVRSSFDASPPVLKKCIFYLLIFPQDSIIRRRRLVRRWMAEGYSKGIGSNSLEEDAEKLFDKIDALGIIQRAQPSTSIGNVKRKASWQVNYLCLEYIISWQTEEKIFLPLEVSVLEGKCSLTTGRVGQHLTIHGSWEGDEFVFDSLDFSRLRSLTVLGEWRPFYISEKMRVLRVLDLEGTSKLNDGDLEKIGEMLPRLKFLSLRQCTSVSKLPDSLGDLRQLQTLDIRYTSIATLPKSIIKLRKLQYIRASSTAPRAIDDEPYTPWRSRLLPTLVSCSHVSRRRPGPLDRLHGVKAPRGIGKLTAMHTLGVVNVNNADGDAILRELSHLTRLRKLVVYGINRNNSWGLFSVSWHALTHLTSLSLGLTKGGDKYLLRCLELPENLQRLKLYGHVEKLPYELSKLDNLTKLTLQMTAFLSLEDIQDLGRLKGLRTLRLRFVTDKYGELQFPAKTETTSPSALFCKLNALEIACSSSLRVTFAEKEMRNLAQLKVDYSYGLLLDFSGLEHLASLNQVLLKGPCDDASKEKWEQNRLQHPNKPSLSLERGSRSS